MAIWVFVLHGSAGEDRYYRRRNAKKRIIVDIQAEAYVAGTSQRLNNRSRRRTLFLYPNLYEGTKDEIHLRETPLPVSREFMIRSNLKNLDFGYIAENIPSMFPVSLA